MPAPALGLTARGKITAVVDGDTVRCTVLGVPVTVRLRDCWAPEVNRGTDEERQKGKLAKAFLSELVVLGSPCIVNISTDDAERLSDVMSFGRVVGDVWLEGMEESIAELMIASGHATADKVAK